MTKSTITREENIQAVFDLKAGYTLGLADVEILKRVARMALAALDSEPNRNPVLAYADSYRDMEKQGVESVPIWSVITDLERNIAPLYRHAQQPVVPEEKPMPNPLSMYAVDAVAAIAEVKGWNAFRAAMLAAAPTSIPMNSDGWIPVSERMPEVGVKVLAFPVEDEPIHAIFNGQLWLQDISWSSSDEPIDNVIPRNVTHWMPLPAAPQEAINALIPLVSRNEREVK